MILMLWDSTDVPSDMPSLVINLPGDAIPDWFAHQTTQSSLSVHLPPQWVDHSEMRSLISPVGSDLQPLYQVLIIWQTHNANRFNNKAGTSGSATVVDETQPSGSASFCDKERHDAALSEPVDPIVEIKGKLIQE